MPTTLFSIARIRLPAALLVISLHHGCGDGYASVPLQEGAAPPVQTRTQPAPDDKPADNPRLRAPLLQ
jgi:hypothetical protein